MTWSISTSLPVNFTIEFAPNILHSLDSMGARTLVVIDSRVKELYSKLLPKNVIIHSVYCEEHTKSWETIQSILEFLEEEKVLRRSEPIYAIGGGVLLDMVGYACSIYRRGIPYIRIPTTLLAIVDASVGSKTGINHLCRRNRLGSYYSPSKVLLDTSFIQTQDARHISNGLAEILKLALVLDSELFNLIEQHSPNLIKNKFQSSIGNQVINLSINGMISELKDNLWEQDLKRAVDFGHTFSPIVEITNSKSLLHGEAVILDCLLSCCISHNRNLLTKVDLDRIFNTVKSCMLPIYHHGFDNIELVLTGLDDVTKHRDGNQNIPLVTDIGKHVFVNDVTKSEIIDAHKLWKQY